MGGIESEIVKKIELGNSFEDKGDFNKALEVYFSALTDIEDAIVDKYKSEEARWLISCICGVYFLKKEYLEAKKWALETLKYNIPEHGTSELIDLGAIYFELEDNDNAFECFSKAYARGKGRAFQGYNKKYFDFFKSYKK